MRGSELNARIRASLEKLLESTDELRDLDQSMGDGDLGITISAGSTAVISALEALPEDTAPSDLATVCARAFANANPSTMAALVAGALLAGSRTWTGKADIGVSDVQEFVDAGAASIARRGKTQVGDKTILDGLAGVSHALEDDASATEALDAAVLAAAAAVESTTGLQSRRGRASWLQERSIGIPDPGATALLRFVEAWRATGTAPAD